MRKLTLFAIGFALACCLCVYWLPMEPVGYLACITGAMGGILLLLDKRFRGSKYLTLDRKSTRLNSSHA